MAYYNKHQTGLGSYDKCKRCDATAKVNHRGLCNRCDEVYRDKWGGR